MKWIKASEQLPESTNAFPRQIVVRWTFSDDTQKRISTVNQFLDTIKLIPDLSKIEWLDESESESQTEGGWLEIAKQARLPEFIEGKDYSENVLAILNGELTVMCLALVPDDNNQLCYAWCNCNGDINGDGEFDDNYYPTHWMPLPSPPTPSPTRSFKM